MGDWREKVRQITSEENIKQQEAERIRNEEARRAQEFLDKIGTRDLLETVKTEAWKVGEIRNLISRRSNTIAIQLFHLYPAPAPIIETYRDMFNREQSYATGGHYITHDIRSITVGLRIFPSEALAHEYTYQYSSTHKGFLLYVVRDSYGSYSGNPISDSDWAYGGSDFDDSRWHFNKPKRTMHIDNLVGNEEDARKFIEDDVAGYISPLPLQLQKEGADNIVREKAVPLRTLFP